MSSSRELALRIYQLKRHENLNQVLSIPWEAFARGEIPEPLKPFLVVPADTPPQLRPREDFFIRRRERKLININAVKGTGALLIVARGRHQGESPLQLVTLDAFDRSVALCFDKYDVFKDPSTWPCGRDSSGAEE